MKISEILRKYDTDKAKEHSYGEAYDELFSYFDRNAPLNILEIGTQKGGSLLAWKEFFPNAKVTGIDIVDVVKPEYKSKDISYIFDDVKNVTLSDTFDIIIDDGSHFISDVMYVVKNFSPKLNKGGIMVIEDVQDVGAWRYNIDHVKGTLTSSAIDLRGVKGNYDDYLIVLHA